MTSRRVLVWDGCVNVRDLGGIPLRAGGETRYGVVIRADSIRKLSDRGWRTLVHQGVRLALDLRSDAEAVEDRSRELPIDVRRIPIPGEEEPAVRAWRSMHEAYAGLLETFRGQFGEAVQALAEAKETVVVHCAGGRDRTGLVSALVLTLVGAEPEAIAADHAFSDTVFAPTVEAWIAEAPTMDERERRRRIVLPAGRTMLDVLRDLDRRDGGVEEYLLASGVDPSAFERLRLTLT